MRRFDYAAAARMRRLYPRPLPLSDADQARFDALRGEDVFAPEDIARTGAFVAIAHDGAARIERGFLRPEDDPGKPRQPRTEKEGPPALSAKLVADLTERQTISLRDALGNDADAALTAITHALTAELFMPQARVSCLQIHASSRFLDTLAPGIAEGPAAQRIEQRHDAWAKRLPEEPSELWAFVAGLGEADRLALLAHCVALSVDAVRMREDEAKPGAPELAASVRLDMCRDWQPTAAGYFTRVSRTRILDAVREGVSSALRGSTQARFHAAAGGWEFPRVGRLLPRCGA